MASEPVNSNPPQPVVSISRGGSFIVPRGVTAEQVILALLEFPPEARIHVDSYKGDQREPGYTTVRASW